MEKFRLSNEQDLKAGKDINSRLLFLVSMIFFDMYSGLVYFFATPKADDRIGYFQSSPNKILFHIIPDGKVIFWHPASNNIFTVIVAAADDKSFQRILIRKFKI